jgi:hypothetical protein
MFRTALGLGVVAVLLATAGCRMCCHPYDYCGPVYNGRGCQSCSPHSRTGSILSGAPELAPMPGLARRQVQGESVSRASLKNQVQGDIRPGDVPGSEQIVSVTDRVVDPSAVSSNPPQVAAEAAPEPLEPLPAKGWTARRPTPEVTR